MRRSNRLAKPVHKFSPPIVMTTLQARIEELVAIARAENPSVPEWYIKLAVEKYIRDEEYEYFKEEIEALIAEIVEEKISDTNKETVCPC